MKLLSNLADLVTGNPMVLMWIFLAGLALGAIPAGALVWKVQGWRLEAVQSRFDGFVKDVKVKGEAAQLAADATKAADKLKKEQADHENSDALATLAGAIKRLRDARPAGGFLPPAAAGSRSPEVASFDRAKLESAIRVLDTEVSGIVATGDEARVNLDSGKRWALTLTTTLGQGKAGAH